MRFVLRLLPRLSLGVVLATATLAGIATAGVTVSMGDAFRHGSEAGNWPASRAVPPGRKVVAVVVGGSGSVVSDALAPYEVFARSSAFSVYTVSETRAPTPLSGGLQLVPDYALDNAPTPDVVVVPAVADPTGPQEAPLRAWITRQAAHGARVLGVCAGAQLLAATGLLDGRQATSFWSIIGSLQDQYPAVHWQRGRRYVQDGPVITTAGVTSGIVGALRVVEQVAGAKDAARIGNELAYPGWSLDGPTEIPAQQLALADLPYGLNSAFPWLRPTIGVGLADGMGEIDIAATVEINSGTSFAATVLPVGVGHTVTTRHGLLLLTEPEAEVARLLVPGTRNTGEVDPGLRRWATDHRIGIELPNSGQGDHESSYDPVLRNLATNTDQATARTTAKFTEYPSAQLQLSGTEWPWRPTGLLILSLAAAVGVGFLPTIVTRLAHRRRQTSSRCQPSR